MPRGDLTSPTGRRPRDVEPIATVATDDPLEVALEAPVADSIDQHRSSVLDDRDELPAERPLEVSQADLLDHARGVAFDDELRDERE